MKNESIVIKDRVVAININKTYREGMSDDELYEYTRGIWRLDRDRAENAKYAFAVYQGEIKGVFEIKYWERAGTTKYEFREFPDEDKRNRFEFVGEVADDRIREKYINKTMPESHSQNPIKYYKC